MAWLDNVCFAVWSYGIPRLHPVLFYCKETQKGRECRYYLGAADLERTMLLALDVLLYKDSVRAIKPKWLRNVFLRDHCRTSFCFWGAEFCLFFCCTLDIRNPHVVFSTKALLNPAKERIYKRCEEAENYFLEWNFTERCHAPLNVLRVLFWKSIYVEGVIGNCSPSPRRYLRGAHSSSS